MQRSVAAVLVVLSACGGGPSKTEFVSRWDAICAREERAVAAVPVPDVRSTKDLPAFADALGRAIPIAQREVSELQAVAPPKADRSTVGAILADLERATSALSQAEAAARNADAGAVERAQSLASAYRTQAGRAARAYGFKRCGH